MVCVESEGKVALLTKVFMNRYGTYAWSSKLYLRCVTLVGSGDIGRNAQYREGWLIPF